jgi:CheY-like chemotaxis protein
MNREVSNGAVTVLVVQDEPFILDMVSEELTGEGFSVLEAKTGEVALSIIESGQMVDVLFTGGIGRLAACRDCTRGKALPVIYTSGYAVDQGTAVPGSVFLKMPYLPSAITETIQTLSPTLNG